MAFALLDLDGPVRSRRHGADVWISDFRGTGISAAQAGELMHQKKLFIIFALIFSHYDLHFSLFQRDSVNFLFYDFRPGGGFFFHLHYRRYSRLLRTQKNPGNVADWIALRKIETYNGTKRECKHQYSGGNGDPGRAVSYPVITLLMTCNMDYIIILIMQEGNMKPFMKNFWVKKLNKKRRFMVEKAEEFNETPEAFVVEKLLVLIYISNGTVGGHVA